MLITTAPLDYSKMTRQEKKEVVAGLVKRLASTDYFYIIDAQGLNLEQVNDFRRKCFQDGVSYQVVKNTLIQKALEQLETNVDYTDFNDQVLKGFSGILFPLNAANTPAKLIKEFRKEQGASMPLLKGAFVDSDFFIGEEHLETLCNLKSKEELIGEVIGLLQSPAKKVVSALQSGKHQLSGVLQTLAEKK